MSRQKVLVLGGSAQQLPAIRVARELGFHVLCVDYDRRAVGFGEADESFVVSTMDLRGVERLARENAVDYVITSTSDAPVRTCAYVSERLGLSTGISYADAICATEKDAMRTRLRERGVPVPDFFACKTMDEYDAAVLCLGGDCIVKPADAAASRGITRLLPTSGAQARAEAFRKALSSSRKSVVMVERFACGPEVSVESMTVAGATTVLAITDKHTRGAVEYGHAEPSGLGSDACEAIRRTAVDVVEAIGIITGPSHTEIKLTEEGPVVIETAARLGGGCITSDLVPLSTGVDIVRASVAWALGIPTEYEPRWTRGAAVRHLVPVRSGRVTKLVVPDDLTLRPGVEKVHMALDVEEEFHAKGTNDDKRGYVICTGDSSSEAYRRAEEAVRSIVLELDGRPVEV